MHFYDTQNNRQENFAHIQASAMWLGFSWSLCRGLKLQHECNSRKIGVNAFSTRFKSRTATYRSKHK